LSWVDVDTVREFTQLETDEIDDSSLQVKIDAAENEVRKEINVFRQNVELTKNDNNDLWSVPDAPIADRDFDKEVTSDDVIVYSWSDKTDPSTKQEVTVNNVYPLEGMLDIDPPNDYVTADYSHYLHKSQPDWDLIEEATAYMAGYLATRQILGKLPPSKMGAFRVDTDNPGAAFEKDYKRVINRVKVKMAQ
jgi:hypothetical protein